MIRTAAWLGSRLPVNVAHGLAVVGFYHSHPHSLPEPSVTDLIEASYPDHLYLIVSPSAERARVRIFRFVDGRFAETPFLTSAAPA